MMQSKVERAIEQAPRGNSIEAFRFMGSQPFGDQPADVAGLLHEHLGALSMLLGAVQEDQADARKEGRETEVGSLTPGVMALVHDSMRTTQALAAYFTSKAPR